MNDQIEELKRVVNEAQQAVIEAQANDDPRRFQHSHLLLQQAKDHLDQAYHTEFSQEDQDELIRVKDLMRQLDETQQSIEATD